jgi:kynurenine 3-monooxygenase
MRTEAIPMYGRMIHHLDGHLESQSYDPIGGQAGWSISRPVLNQRLVEALPDNITFRFNTKLGHIDFRKRVAYGVGVAKKVAPGQEDDDGRIAGDGKVKEYKSGEEDREGTGFDLVIGCDGTWSKVRSEMMRAERWVRRFHLCTMLSPSGALSGGRNKAGGTGIPSVHGG